MPKSEKQTEKKGDKPVFVARARQKPDSEFMVTIGAAWPFKDGEGFVVKLQQTPVQWDGSFLLVPPKDE
ncbi:MAG: hypothetical protein ACLQME_07915 [Alphaproteobacteria bacterium]